MPLKVVRKAEPISTGEDMARSAGTGLIEGGASTFGGIGDLREMLGAGAKWAGDKLGAEGLTLPGLPEPMPVRVLRQATQKTMQAAGVDPRISKLATIMTGPGGVSDAPTSREVTGAVTKDKPLYQPQTKAGKYSRTVASFAPAALTPGGPVRKAANVVVPGLMSEAAGQATEGSQFEPYARVAAAMVGAGGVNALGRGGPDTRMLAEASRGATDDQITAATQLMQTAQGQGLRLTMAEALQQVTNGATGMGRLQRVIEGTKAGNARMGPAMAERPAQVSGAVTRAADNIAPQTADPYVLGQQASEAAGQTLTGVRQQVNANARPFYEALQTEQMPPTPMWRQVQQRPEYQQALAAIRNDEILNRELASLPDDSLAVVDKVVQQLDTMAANARPNPASPTGNAQLSSAFDTVRGQVDELASAYSEPWRLSRSMVASGREAFLEPLQAGPMGAISQTGDVGAQTRALFPNAPPEGAATQTGQTLEMLPQEVSAPLVRQHLMNSFNEASQQNLGGDNQWGGAKWAAGVAGNPEQSAVLGSGLEAVGADRQQFDALLEALRATGRRERPGSLTAYNSRDIEELGKAGMTGEVARTGLNPPGIFRRIGEGFQNWQTERNAGRLAEAIMANPQDAQRILMRAREVVPAGPELQAIERAALAAQLALASE
jgi:hypothetical protein